MADRPTNRPKGPSEGNRGPRGAKGPQGHNKGAWSPKGQGSAAQGGPRPERPAKKDVGQAPRREPSEQGPSEEFGGSETRDLIWGRHAVLAVLEGDRPVNKVWLLRSLERDSLFAQVRKLAKPKGAIVQLVDRGKLDQLANGEAHQGLIASVAATSYTDFDDLVAAAMAQPRPLVVVLDGIEDPHNLGALIRTANGAGAHGVIIPQRRAVGLTGTVEKSSAGAVAYTPVARVTNLVRAIEDLKEAGFWVVGAEAEGPHLPYEVDMTGPIALVVGSEGSGMGRLVSEKCDYIVRLPLLGQVPSLNASVAGGVLLYEIVRQRVTQDPSLVPPPVPKQD